MWFDNIEYKSVSDNMRKLEEISLTDYSARYRGSIGVELISLNRIE